MVFFYYGQNRPFVLPALIITMLCYLDKYTDEFYLLGHISQMSISFCSSHGFSILLCTKLTVKQF